MFTDGVSLPGLSEKIMYQTCFKNLRYPNKVPAIVFSFPIKRMIGYKSQDAEAKHMFLKGFRYKKLLEFNSDKPVYSIDKEEKEICGKMKANIAGGPSIIFNRYAKRNETKI
ncbi:hypothetical protein L917_19570 [Phytophthora nicotianae]|nr:hypothetical protein L917_19570 [Phytophthora nicotianae]